MRAGWCADNHQADAWIVEHLLLALMHSDRPVPSRHLAPLSRKVADTAQVQAAGGRDRSRVVAADRAVTDEPHAHRRRGRPTGDEEEQPSDKLLKVGIPIRCGLVSKTHVDEATGAMAALVRHNLLGEPPARAQQDRCIDGRTLRKVELVGQLPIPIEPLGHGMVSVRVHDQFGQRSWTPWSPPRHLGDRLRRQPRVQRAVEHDQGASPAHERAEGRCLARRERLIGGREDDVVARGGQGASLHAEALSVERPHQRQRSAGVLVWPVLQHGEHRHPFAHQAAFLSDP